MHLVTHGRSPENKVAFRVRRVNGIAEGAAPQLDMVVHGRSIAQLRANIASALRICFGHERRFQMLVGTASDDDDYNHDGDDPTSIHAGDEVVMIVNPPPQYAGSRGAHAVVVSAAHHVYVEFEGGLLETYPLRLFLTFFVRVPRANA